MAEDQAGLEFQILVCPHCFAKNAVYQRDLDKTLRCRKCGARFTRDQAPTGKDKPKTKSAGDKMPNLSGRQLGHFKLMGVLGSGAMGVVYRAQDTMLMRDVAVKVLPKDISDKDPKGLERFLNEARTAAQLVHPNVVQIFHIAQAEGTYFIAMEFVRGGTAERAAALRGGRLDEAFAMEKMLEGADAMAMAHRRKIYHRDLKPANLLLTTEGTLKVADFGLAVWTDSPEADLAATNAPHIVGTPQFMSPEQCRGQPGDAASDVYSLGTTFYRLTVGHPPFKATNAMGYFQAHINAPVPNPLESMPELNPQFCDLLVKCLAKNPQERPTAAYVAQYLREITGGRRGPSISMPPINLGESNAMLMAPSERPGSSFAGGGGNFDTGASQTFANQSNYLGLFGLSYYPFNDVRNPNAFWNAGPYAGAAESLAGAIDLGCSPVLLLGPPGSGRTFIASMVQRQIGAAQTLIIQPKLLGSSSLLAAICRQLAVQIDLKTATGEELLSALLDKIGPSHQFDRRTLIIIDEVKLDRPDFINDLRELLMHGADRPNLSVLLIGNVDLPTELGQLGIPTDLRGASEPVVIRTMTQQEMSDYIDFRLQTVGRTTTPLKLSASATQLLHRRSAGVPRLVNIFCHNALTLASHAKQPDINVDLLWRAMHKKSYVTNIEALPASNPRPSDVWRKLELLKAMELVKQNVA